jgi:CheY-like chemotaxis protein
VGGGADLLAMEATEPPRILLVEDESVTRTVVSRMLGTFGMSVDLAFDGPHALDQLRVNHYDLVFMDCHLPGLDGFEVTRRLRAAEGTATAADVPVVALTADRKGADVAPCLAAGMNGHMSKPVSLGALASTLERWLPTNTTV